MARGRSENNGSLTARAMVLSRRLIGGPFVMNRIRLALAAVIISVAAASAAADVPWHRGVTNQGCVIYWQFSAASPEEFARETAFTWSGSPCERGKPLNGKGTLTFRLIAGELAKMRADPTARFMYTGSIVDGVMNGPVRAKSVTHGKMRDFGIYRYKMGCDLDHEPFCVPRKR